VSEKVQRQGQRGRAARWLAAAALVGVALSGCAGLGQAGAAADVGTTQISSQTLAADVAAVQEQRGVPAGTANSALTLSVLQRLIISELVDQAATAQGVTVTQGEIDQARAELEAQLGGADALVAAYLDADVPITGIEQQIALSLQVRKLGAFLAPDADPNSQQQAVLQYVTGFGLQEGIEVSPRFGTWDAGALRIGPLPSDLSTVVEPADPLAELIPAP
jgi:hypothetical protein